MSSCKENKSNFYEADDKKVTVHNRASVEGEIAGSLKVSFLNYGCVIQEIWVADSNGKLRNVCLGFETVEGYKDPSNPYFGAIIGRYANRIAKGAFTLDGKEYQVDKNERGVQTLHGGSKGWDKQEWVRDVKECDNAVCVIFKHTSPDGDMGFPGKMDITVTYVVPKDRCEVTYKVEAVTDKTTVVNMTNHCYFNLKGHDCGSIEDTEATILSDEFVPVKDGIPIGVLKSVEGTAFDFRTKKTFSEGIGSPTDPDIKIGCGYDHCFMFKQNIDNSERRVAKFSNRSSGVSMDVWTNCPGGQLYTGFWIDVPGKYGRYAGFAMETGNAASAMHHPGMLPNCIVKPGETYKNSTTFRFSNF